MVVVDGLLIARTILFVLNSSCVVLHSFGMSLLLEMYKSCQYPIQQVYLINLSFVEALINLLEALKYIRFLVGTSLEADTLEIVDKVISYILIFQFTGIALVFYIQMTYMTLDKLMDIVLNIRYPVYWNERKTKYLLIVTWFLVTCLAIVVSVLYKYFAFDWMFPFYTYVYPTICYIFVFTAIFAYSFIFKKFKATRHVSTVGNSDAQNGEKRRRRSSVQVFKKSRFYIPVLLILTFFIFFIVPDTVFLILVVLDKAGIKPDSIPLIEVCCWMSYAIGNLTDVYIYIYTNPKTRERFYKKIGLRRLINVFKKNEINVRNNNNSSEDSSDVTRENAL